jgi:prolyl-tRNA synthetase
MSGRHPGAPPARTLVDDLRRRGVRVELDDRLESSLGRRIVDHGLRGLPLRIELGPRISLPIRLSSRDAREARRKHGP